MLISMLIRYEPHQTISISFHETVSPIFDVSLITLECMAPMLLLLKYESESFCICRNEESRRSRFTLTSILPQIAAEI